MLRIHTFPLALCALVLAAPLTASAVTIATVPVGNPLNSNDTFGFGAVAYEYRIAKYEVTNGQYVEFLNFKDQTGANSLALYNSAMTSDARGGINFTAGNTNGSKYSAKVGRDNNPVVFVSFYDSLRFANWLNNGQGTGDTETGAYTLSSGSAVARNAGAAWFLPSENEWYKAAYHQPAAQGGDSDHYWLVPLRTNGFPSSDQPPGSDAPTQSITANFSADDATANGYDDGFAVTGSPTFVSSQNYLTDVGAYTLSNSFYGTFDQGGNVWEWNEGSIDDGSDRPTRGGSWFPTGLGDLGSINALIRNATLENNTVGFRVATVVPEPSTAVLAIVACGMMWWWRKRFE